jgi:hypothetical protein
VSIGLALAPDASEIGMADAVRANLRILMQALDSYRIPLRSGYNLESKTVI